MSGRRKNMDEARARSKGQRRVQRPERPRRVERVRKRDGREVAFELSKIQAALEAALSACGQRDESFAAEVAQVVELTLAQGAKGATSADGVASVPSIEEVQDLVERALMELGKPEVAKAYILYRERRREMRDAVRVHDREGKERGTAMRARPRVREAEGVSSWSRGRIVAALIEEAELPRATAEEVASAVEERVLATAPRHVTTGLVRELVASELFERGLSQALARQSRIGVGRRDVRLALEGRALQPWRESTRAPRSAAPARGAAIPSAGDATGALGGELLRRYVVSDVLPEGVAELHLSGDLFVEGLERAHLPLSLAVEAELFCAGRTPEARAAALLDGAAELTGETARHLVLERPDSLLNELAGGSGGALSAWLHALGAVARARRVRIGLRLGEGVSEELLCALISALAAAPERAGGLELFVEGDALQRTLEFDSYVEDAVEALFQADRLGVVWGSSEETFAAPGARRRPGERGAIACGGAVALHLPRLARRATPEHEELIQSGLAELVHAALEAARALITFQADAGRQGALGMHVRRSFALVPVGLREALLLASAEGIDPEQGARWLGLIAEAAGRFALEGSDTVAPCGFFGEEAAGRFAWLDARDAELERPRQPSLFDEAEEVAPRSYRSGLGISPLPGVPAGAAEARLWHALSAGVWRGTSAQSNVAPHPALSAWRRFHGLRLSDTTGSTEPTRELFPVRGPSSASDSATKRPVALRPLP